MKVVHIVRGDFSPLALNGVYKVVDNISIALSKLIGGVIVCSVDKNVDGEIYQPDCYKHVRFKEHPLRFFLDRRFKAFLLEQPKDTVFHFHSVFIPWFLPAVKLLRKHGYSRIVLTPHGQYIDEAMNASLKKRVFFRFFDRKVLRLVDAVQAVGQTELNGYMNSNAKQSFLIPNGCNPAYAVISCERSLVFGYMGRLDIKQKGLDVLIKAFAFYRKQGGTGVLRIAGDGADSGYMRGLCRQLGVTERVEFVGKVFGDKKKAFLDSCAWFMHPSNWDVVPTGCMEAASQGVPLVVSKETNMQEYIERYGAGLVMRDDRRPVQALAERLSEAENIFGDEAQYRRCCMNARRMVAEELNWDAIARKDIKLLYNGDA